MPSDRKTEPATPRRLRQARRDGDHPVSRALIGFGALALLLVLAPLVLEALYASSHALLRAALRPEPAPVSASALALRVGALTSPLLGGAALGALVIGLWQTGGVLSAKPLGWNLQRLNPLAGREGLAPRALSLLVAVATALAIGVAAWAILRDASPALAASVGDAEATLRIAGETCRRLGWWALGISLVSAVADSALRRAQWRARHRMTPEEVRRELREDLGDPELRHVRRQVHREHADPGEARDESRATRGTSSSAP